MTITALPASPNPLTDSQSSYNSKSLAFTQALPTFVAEANALQTDVNASAAAAAGAAVVAVAIEQTALAASSYKGSWAALAGPMNMPASVSHAGTFWALASNLADVTSATPGVSASWVAIVLGSIPQNVQSANYTFVAADSGKHILHPSADTSARIFTIPSNAAVQYPIGTVLTVINQAGAGAITLSITSDVMRLSPSGTTGSRALVANGVLTAVKIAATEWIVNGTGLS